MLNEFLRRFREAGVPGAPAAAGAPADPAVTLEVELMPVFALLEDVEHEADAVESEGRRQAEQRRAEGAEHARALLEEARAHAAGEQAAAAAVRIARSDEECEAQRRQAAAEAARVDQAATERIPPLIAELVEHVLGEAGSGATP